MLTTDYAICLIFCYNLYVNHVGCELHSPPFPELATLYLSTTLGANTSISVMYNKISQVCCEGRVYPQPELYSYVSCCGSTQYSINKEVCCFNVAYPIKTSHVCCGNKYHNPQETACCHHPYTGQAYLVVIATGTEKYNLCCGIRAYDARTHICCTMEVSEMEPVRPSSNQFVDRVTRFIIYERKFQHTACCKGKAYNAESGACADVQLTSRSLWTRLRPDRTHPIGICGHETYDTKIQWCCSGPAMSGDVMVNRVSHLPCCGVKSYDQETHLCCGGVIQVQNEYGSLLCCNKGGVYDARYQECCDYSYNIIPSRLIVNRGDMCCGMYNTPYHSYRQACCANTVIDVPQTSHGDFRCCINPYQADQVILYVRDEEICCDGVKYLLTSLNSHCCGQDAYSPEAMLCCDGVLHVKLSPFDSCCGPIPYNGHSHVCCGREEWSAMKRNPKTSACCIRVNKQWTYFNKTCCNVTEPKIHPRLARTNACCKLDLYDTRTHICCNGIVIDRYLKLCCRVAQQDSWDPLEHVVNKRSFNSECCGASSYNPQSQICCNNTHVSWMGLDDLACCGSAVYDRQSQMCCDLTIREKRIDSIDCCGNKLFNRNKEICCEKTKTILTPDAGEESHTGCCFKE